jgi:putative inorganic carbon (hco3(-)) transporter
LLFWLFVLLSFVLLVRPEELFGDFAGGRLYLVVMCCCIPVALGRILDRLANLRRDPVTCCVLAFFAFTVASCILPLGVTVATDTAVEFGKVVIAYLVGLAALETPRAYRRYLVVLPLLIAGIAAIAFLSYYGYIDQKIVSQAVQNDFDAAGEPITYMRLSSSGVFNDPNDLCLVLAVGLALCAYQLIERANTLAVLMSVLLVPYFIYALMLTQSRGGLLAVAAMFASLAVSRFGAKRALPIAVFGVIGLLALASGRQASFDAGSGTAQTRIQHWTEGLELWETHPILGVGYLQHEEHIGLAAHNSYVHAFVETGALGGIAFVGIFFTLMLGLALTPRIADDETTLQEELVNRSRPFVIAMSAGYCMGMYSLSRNYVIPTYLLAALGNSCLWISHPPFERTWFVMDGKMLRRIVFAGLGVLLFHKVFVKLLVSY